MEAPLQETLAAALIRATGWDGVGHFVNPMCGSGTLAIEAALLARRVAAGLGRKNFGFMHLLGYREKAWQDLQTAARQEILEKPAGRIVATDIRPEAVEAARRNARTAGVDRAISFAVCPFGDTPLPPGQGVVVINPPYGERMGELAALGETYQAIGDFLKRKGQGYQGFIFTGNPGLAKRVGLRTRQRLTFFNGDIECRLLHYDLYQGSRKTQGTEDVPASDQDRPSPPAVPVGSRPENQKTLRIIIHAKKSN
jgi:putative N6-adenine-specific DNA methylase